MLELHGTVTEIRNVLNSLVVGSNNTSRVCTNSSPDMPISSVPTSYPSTVSKSSMVTLSFQNLTSTASTFVQVPMTTTSMSLQSPITTTGSLQVGISTNSAPIQAPIATASFVEPVCEVEIDNANFMPDADVMQIVLKSCSRMKFTARLSVRLFYEETRLTHNVSDHGKPKFDPKRISFIKTKCFEIFQCHVT